MARHDSLRLYERVEHLDVVRDLIDERGEEIAAAGGVLPDWLEAAFDDALAAVENKVELTALAYREQEEIERWRAVEAKRLKALEKSARRAQDAIKAYLLLQLRKLGRRDIETPTAKVYLQANPAPKIEPVDPSSPPEEFVRYRLPALELTREELDLVIKHVKVAKTALPKVVGKAEAGRLDPLVRIFEALAVQAEPVFRADLAKRALLPDLELVPWEPQEINGVRFVLEQHVRIK